MESPTFNKSIPFIQQTPKGLQINQEALAFISSLPSKKCHILSILGRAKTGKSTLMNHLVHQFLPHRELQQWFAVSNHLGGGTKGINILTTYGDVDDQNILLFLDVQGVGSLANSQAYESKLYAVALLLSTTLIYNNVGAIDEPALQSLSIFIQIGKMLEQSIIKPNHKKQTTPFPSLVLALRDFSLQLEDKQGLPVTPNQYLEYALQEQKGGSQTIFHKNRIRRTIKEMFRKRSCETLVLLSDQLPITFTSPIRSQFKKGMNHFFSKIKSHFQAQAQTRKLFQPNQLALYVQQLIVSVNSNIRLPTFDIILESVSNKQILTVKQKCKANISQLIKQFDHQANIIENTLEFITSRDQLEDSSVKANIIRLQKFSQLLEQICLQKQLQIEHLIQKGKAQTIDNKGKEQIRDIQSIKNNKGQQINNRIEDLKHTAQFKQRQLKQKYLSQRQAEQFQLFIEQLCLIQSEKDLQQKYTNYINDLRDRCEPINSKQFQTGLLKCEVAFLRRKIELKQRQPKVLIEKDQQITISKPAQRKLLKYQTNNPQQYSQNKLKTQNLQKKSAGEKGQLSKAFYVPYIVLCDTSIMNVEIIKTLIKQDHRLNNYFEYVLQVVIMERRWVFNRKWKDFNELHSILTTLFQQILLPPFAYTQLTIQSTLQVHKEEVEDRRKKLQAYLRQLLQIEPIRNSRIMQKFLKINKEYVPSL